jgi:hypothetical protein
MILSTIAAISTAQAIPIRMILIILITKSFFLFLPFVIFLAVAIASNGK